MYNRRRPWCQTIYGSNIIAFSTLAVITYFDYYIFYEIDMALFYLVPIAWVAWYGKGNTYLTVSLLAVLIWSGCEFFEREHYSSNFIYFWAIGIHTSGFIGTSVVLRKLQVALAEAKKRADCDFLTGLPNRQCFYRLARYNIERSRKLDGSLTVVYLDVDNFKQVNDTLGHDAGDELLKCIAKQLQESLRHTDVVARLGGDEFAILLPNTDFEAAKKMLERVHQELQRAVDLGGWPVTFSIGACVFVRPPEIIDQLLKEADALMYAVKRDGKNKLRCCLITENQEHCSK